MKNKVSIINLFLAPFLFILDFIKHFFIGIKFIFIDSWIIIFKYLASKKRLKSKNLSNEIFHKNLSINNKEETKILNYEEKQKIAQEKNKLIKEMEKEIKSRKIEKDYYYYFGIKDGKKVKGFLKATNKVTLHNFLANDNIDVYSIKKATFLNLMKKIGFNKELAMTNKELIFWLTQVSTYLASGLTLNDTIKLMQKHASKDTRKSKLYQSILYELTLGESFSVALSNQGNVFPPLLINMIKSAEATGELIKTLGEMAEYYTEIDKTRKEMLSAIIYPTMLLIFAISVMAFVMIFVIPEFIKIYDQAGIVVNGFTLSIINLSKYITTNINVILMFAILLIVTILFLYRKSKNFRKSIQTFGMHIPFFGNIIIYHEITIFTKTFSSLLKNSVYITESMQILSNITNNEVYKDIMYETITNIARGEKISLSFYNKWCIPDVAYYMIVTGETTGELSLMMEKVANYYSREHKNKVTNLKSFLEPIMIVILALTVCIIILAVVIPMFSLYGQIG